MRVVTRTRPGSTGRHGSPVRVDVLEDAVLLEDVEARVLGAVRGPQALGGGIEVERAHAERRLGALGGVRVSRSLLVVIMRGVIRRRPACCSWASSPRKEP